MTKNASEVGRVRASLEEGGLVLDGNLAQAAAEAVLDELAPVRFRAVDRSLTEKNTAYAIKNSDLDLVREIGTVAAAAAVGLPNAASVIVGLLVFLARYRKKRIRLTGDQALVLKILSAAETTGYTLNELVNLVSKAKKMATQEVEAILTSLTTTVQVNGVPTSLVSQRDYRWYAIDV